MTVGIALTGGIGIAVVIGSGIRDGRNVGVKELNGLIVIGAHVGRTDGLVGAVVGIIVGLVGFDEIVGEMVVGVTDGILVLGTQVGITTANCRCASRPRESW